MRAPTKADAGCDRSTVAERFQPMIAVAGVVGCLLIGATGWITTATAQAPRQAAAVDAQTVKYPSGNAQIESYIARPRTPGKHPAIIVVHDDLGLNEPIRNVARLFAQAGFVALAPNLLSRGGAAPAQPAMGPQRPPASRLPVNQTVQDVRAGFTFLEKDAGVDATKISAIGLGWGGFRVWRLAQQVPTLHRAVVFYGVTPSDDQLGKISAPVLGHYAQYDFLLTASVLKTQKQLGKKFTYHVYPTDRGFFGGGSSGSAIDITALAGEVDLFALSAPGSAPQKAAPGRAEAAPARLALERTLAFLRN